MNPCAIHSQPHENIQKPQRNILIIPDDPVYLIGFSQADAECENFRVVKAIQFCKDLICSQVHSYYRIVCIGYLVI